MATMQFSMFDVDALKGALGGCTAEKIVELAKIAENAERYEDMCCLMRIRVLEFESQKLNVEERNFLSVAYKNVIGARRASWRSIVGEAEGDTALGGALAAYKEQIEKELENISHNVLELLEKHLIAKSDGQSDEEKVFYLKMAGDYYRYLVESVAKDGYKEKTEELYEKAFELASSKLTSTHPIRLGLALNYSVCKYEILGKPKEACEMAKKAFDDAISALDDLQEADYKDSTLIMQLLRDNLTLWTSANSNDGDDLALEDMDN